MPKFFIIGDKDCEDNVISRTNDRVEAVENYAKVHGTDDASRADISEVDVPDSLIGFILRLFGINTDD